MRSRHLAPTLPSAGKTVPGATSRLAACNTAPPLRPTGAG